ncbi:MAG: ketoacyl-ACP synthase III [Candidatus Azobacteroides sp.]|nr:ketoacyl-ACP synthase III [Candidatus Azobacteroides sp.]
MAFLKIENVKISGISACVPEQIDENNLYPLFDDSAYKNFVSTTGVERKRKSAPDVCTSDLCVSAAETLISDLNWNKDEISIVVLVTQSPDYLLPATSIIIQDRLGLSKDCCALDISLGCSGWVYGMSVVAGLLKSSANGSGKALLLAGDISSRGSSPEDKSTYPLFGDAGTATALEYAEEGAPMLFGMNSDGSGYKAIIINDGGYGFRNPFSLSSLDMIERGDGIVSNNMHVVLEGMDVFAFGIKRAPESVNKLIEAFKLDKDKVDYFTFHQANLFMNEMIRKKLKLPAEKVPYSLKDFGNTSSASIPLTMIAELKNELKTKSLNHIACGFGVGLSWGSVYFETDKIVCSDLVEI